MNIFFSFKITNNISINSIKPKKGSTIPEIYNRRWKYKIALKHYNYMIQYGCCFQPYAARNNFSFLYVVACRDYNFYVLRVANCYEFEHVFLFFYFLNVLFEILRVYFEMSDAAQVLFNN